MSDLHAGHHETRDDSISNIKSNEDMINIDPEAGQSARPDSQEDDEPPDGGYGWICVCCCFLINANTWGINSSYGVFLAYYLASNLFPGATYVEYAFVGGLSISQALLVSPIATRMVRIYGTRTTLFVGIFLETSSLIGASFAKEIWQLFLSQGICFGWGMGFQFVASVSITPQWFKKRRSVASGIAAGGSGIGGLVYSLATDAMIKDIGLPWAFRILAVLQFVMNMGSALLLRDRNGTIGTEHLAFDFRLFKRMEFLLFLGWGVFSMLGYVILLFSLSDYSRSIGLNADQGSVVIAVLNLGQGIGRPIVGYFSDAVGRINMAAFVTFLCGFLCFLFWTFAKSYAAVIIFALVIGMISGTFWTAVTPVSVEVLGLKVSPSGLSIMWVVLVLPTTFAEALGLKLRRPEGDKYLYAQVFVGIVYILGSVCLWVLRGWKIDENEKLSRAKDERDGHELSQNPSDTSGSSSAVPAESSMIRRMVMARKV